MSEVQATIEATKAQINDLLDETAIGYHEKVYADVEDGRLRFLAGTPGGTVVAYTDYVEGDIEKIEGDAQAIVKVPALRDHLDLADQGTSSVMELQFVGSEGTTLSEQLKVSAAGSAAFEVGISIPASESALESVPTDLPGLFNDDNVLLNRQEDRPVETHIETYTDTLDQIVQAVDMREELDYYPIVVENEELLLNIGSEQGNYVNATLQGSVEGEDVDNLYGSGFSEVVKSLDGAVTLHLEQGSPLMVLKEGNYGTVRHVLGGAE